MGTTEGRTVASGQLSVASNEALGNDFFRGSARAFGPHTHPLGRTTGWRSRFPGMTNEGRRRAQSEHVQRGLWIVLLGPDGAGKSSVIEGIGDGVAAGFSGCESHHLRPALFSRRRAATANCNPHTKSARGSVVTAGKLAYLLAANWLGYLMRVLPGLKRGTLVVFDRYFPDGLVDPRRYRLPQSCGRLVALVESLLPKPDVYFVLDAPATVLQTRKREVTPDEAERQSREYRRLVEQLPNAVVVDASQPLEKVVDEVVERSIERHLSHYRRALYSV